MRCLILICCIVVSVLLPPSSALALIEAPHNKAAIGSCGNCHGQHLADSPFWGGAPDYNTFCWTRCHNSPTDRVSKGPAAKTHSSTTTNSSRATWGYQCTACHKPHAQEQNNWDARNYAKNSLYLATGYLTGVPSYDGSVTTFAIDQAVGRQIQYKNVNWTPATLVQKTELNRGAVFIPNEFFSSYNYPIYDMAADGSTVSFWGDLRNEPWKSLIASYPFRIIYGQLLKGKVDKNNTPSDVSDDVAVKFYDRYGSNSFADDETAAGTDADPTPDGICQVCHEDTGHWSAATAVGDKHFSAWNCSECHRHPDGFAPSWPDHDAIIPVPGFCASCHADPLFTLHNVTPGDRTNCDRCHRINDNFNLTGSLPYVYVDTEPHTGKDKYMVTGVAGCDSCHHGQYGEHVTDTGHGRVHDRVQLGYDADGNGSADNWIACDACHYADVVQEHVTQREFTCSTCHDAATVAAKVTAAVTKGRSVADGGADAVLFCNECHNSTAGAPNGSLVDKHHLSTQAVSGDCIDCHVIGFGVFGPEKAPCGECHGNGKRFAYQHANAADVDLAVVNDTRACFSCHLTGGAGNAAGGATPPPPVVPLHALPATKPPLWPGDCRNDTTIDATNGVGDLPVCDNLGIAGSYQAENYLDLFDSVSYSWPANPADETASEKYLKRYPGFGLFNYYMPTEHTRPGVYPWGGGPAWPAGTAMGDWPVNAYGKNYNWLKGFLLPYIEANYSYPTVTNVAVPITYTDSSSKTVLTVDGTGEKGLPNGTAGSIKVAISPAGVVAAGAKWRVDGLVWRDGDGVSSQSGLFAPATHLVEFKSVSGWISPKSLALTLASGENKTLSGTRATYQACPDDPRLSFVNIPADMTWSDPLASVAYTVGGWQPDGGSLDCRLDTGGAEGFTVLAGTDSCTILKTGVSGIGSYDFTLTADGSTCFGNSATRSFTVTVDAAGALAPTGPGRITKLSSDPGQVISTNQYYRTIPVNSNLLAVVRSASGATATTVETWGINSDGTVDAAAKPGAASLDMPANKQFYMARVDDDTFVIGRYDELETVNIDPTTGAVSAVGPSGQCVIPDSAGTRASIMGIYPGPAGRFLVGYRRGTPTILQSISIDANGVIGCPISSNSADFWSIGNSFDVMDLLQVSGNIYTVAVQRGGSNGGYLYTFTTDTSGAITATGNSWYFNNGYASLVDLFRVGGTTIFGIAYPGSVKDYRLTLKTFTISVDGSIGPQISSMDMDPFVVSDPVAGTKSLGVVPLTDNLLAINYTYRLVPTAVSTSQFKTILRTFTVNNDTGVLLPVSDTVTESFLASEMQHLDDGLVVAVFDSNTTSNRHLRTYRIDLDGDAVAADADNCPGDFNPDQADTDGDGSGDVCDLCPASALATTDTDSDGIGDLCDFCPADSTNDADGDGLCGGAGFSAPATGDGDNCPTLDNPGQADADSDGIGDICDPAPTLPYGAVAYYPFSEGAGFNTSDPVGGNTGTLSYSLMWDAAGRIGGAVKMTADNRKVTINDSASLRFGTGSLTIEAWLKPTTFSSVDDSGRVRWFEKNNYCPDWATNPACTWLVFEIMSNGAPSFYVRGYGDAVGSGITAGSLSLNAWNHVVYVIDRSTSPARGFIYVNGVNQSGAGVAFPNLSGNLDVTGKPIVLGGGSWADYRGSMDELVFYNRALSAAEVAARRALAP